MRNISLLIVGFMICTQFVLGQNQEIEKPMEGKSKVYFTRYQGLGVLVNFNIYDWDKYIGKSVYGQYVVYECDPGKHIFWATSENRDYLEVDLEAGKTYVVDVEPQMGAFIAQVQLEPKDPNNYKDQKLFYNVIKKHKKRDTSEDLLEDRTDKIQEGIKRYEKIKDEKSNGIKTLETNMNFENANKPVKQKK